MNRRLKDVAEHWLRPLLAPQSIAYVGASGRAGTPGNAVVKMAAYGGYEGRVFPINPRYEEVEGLPCFPSLDALPEIPDLAVLALADQRLEQALTDAIRAGVKSAVIFGGANLIEDTDYKLSARLRDIAKEANFPICGGNGMGFYNLDHNVLLSFAQPPYLTRAGGATLISHSGSSWSALTLNDGRLGFNLAVSSGQELTVGIAEYLDYAVEQASTSVVGLILETIRDPAGFRAALEKANKKQVPVVALKVGRSERSARLAISHSGAIAGDDGAYEAVFDCYGVSRVRTLEELGATLALLSGPKSVGEGALATIHDSGFERELLVDLAHDGGIPFAEISNHTTAKLSELLDPGLEAVNPVDAWGTGHDYERIFIESFDALISDPATAVGFVSHNPRDNSRISETWVDVLLTANQRHDKPVAMVSGFPWTRRPEIIERLTAADIPMIDGMDNAMVAARSLFEQRDVRAREPMALTGEIAQSTIRHWRERLCEKTPWDEAESLSLLADFGIPVVPVVKAGSLEQVLEAASTLPMPVVLKTANPDIHHKTEVDGVRLNLCNTEQVERAYRDIAERLGPYVSLAQMVGGGVEMSLGMVNDEQFGSLVMIGAGGILIEVQRDRRLGLPPFDHRFARGLIDKLQSRTLLDGHRGRPACNVAAFADAASRLSILATNLGDLIAELDVNPIIVDASTSIAVDALVVPLSQINKANKRMTQ